MQSKDDIENQNQTGYPDLKQLSNEFDRMNISILKEINKDSGRDKIFGCIIGSFIGDACGALAPEAGDK